MMFGLPLGFFVESAVAVLLMLTIGYCVVLNSRLKRLHADRSVLQQMVADLVGATNLANQAIKELKTTAMDADLALTARLEEAERFGIELANHVSAGSMLMERIAKITSIARSHPVAVEPVVEETNKVQSALQQLNARARARENAA
jgi:DNA repair ATPase RecN